ncbi:hypothetical protein BKA70DRAFT_1243160 [Coprinopsis sp. MPI-PUGE-AT-0042]|nr:hypothetical protein BKA70DRAFT_1243160 [Coprinopsis sp. MPI-PUGE-AT-0042]
MTSEGARLRPGFLAVTRAVTSKGDCLTPGCAYLVYNTPDRRGLNHRKKEERHEKAHDLRVAKENGPVPPDLTLQDRPSLRHHRLAESCEGLVVVVEAGSNEEAAEASIKPRSQARFKAIPEHRTSLSMNDGGQTVRYWWLVVGRGGEREAAAMLRIPRWMVSWLHLRWLDFGRGEEREVAACFVFRNGWFGRGWWLHLRWLDVGRGEEGEVVAMLRIPRWMVARRWQRREEGSGGNASYPAMDGLDEDGDFISLGSSLAEERRGKWRHASYPAMDGLDRDGDFISGGSSLAEDGRGKWQHASYPAMDGLDGDGDFIPGVGELALVVDLDDIDRGGSIGYCLDLRLGKFSLESKLFVGSSTFHNTESEGQEPLWYLSGLGVVGREGCEA